ncbi:hypothetical protein AVEN_16527-1 [Araneus ventricosus]|uniref:Tc1-like transposase DDE domain-containing protein n=1 Tax=Araneus ventricosus TaxID=182803 RepID=A0A4Y2V3D4_ARAVE|nr:hypothetical protein AVEN_16527-1 [Araneus ventricosus]
MVEIHYGLYPSCNESQIANGKNKMATKLRNVFFQHDDAPAHKTSSVKQYLVEEFGEQIIGYGGFQEWLPHSPYLTSMDFFLWGPQTAGACDPSSNNVGPSMTHYGCLCQRDTRYAIPCATWSSNKGPGVHCS